MRTILAIIVSAAISGSAAYFYLHTQHASVAISSDIIKLQTAHAFVEKRISDIKEDLSLRLVHFSKEVESDRDFAMSLLAHNNRSAPAVTSAAVRYIKPMGFSILEIVDSESVILSSGHFPANAGNRMSEKSRTLDQNALVIKDNIKGEELLTLQSRHSFSIADVPFSVMGGIIIDEVFLKSLVPHQQVDILLKKGDTVKGMNVQSISPLVDGKIIINNREYHASSVELDRSQGETICELIIIAEIKN